MTNVLRFFGLILSTSLTVWGTVALADWAFTRSSGFQPIETFATLVGIHAFVSMMGGLIAGFALRGNKWHSLLLVLPLFLYGLLQTLGDIPHYEVFLKSVFLLLVACSSFLAGIRIARGPLRIES